MEYELSIRDYIAILKRRIWWFFVPFFVVSALGIAGALLLPASYQSTGKILVESQQIPTDLIRSTVTGFANERIQVIEQRVMTRANLLRIAREYSLFDNWNTNRSLTDQVSIMRKRISLQMIEAGRSRNNTTIAFALSYEDRDPSRSLQVTNELVTLFLAENVRTRTERASETTDFLEQEAQKLRQALEIQEDQVTKFKETNSDALPEHLELHLSMLRRSEEELRTVQLEQKALEEELRFLKIEQTATASGLAVSSGPASARNPMQQLVNLRAELIDLGALYHDDHPDVLITKERIRALERRLGESELGVSNSSGDTSLVGLRISGQVAAAEARINVLENMSVDLRKRIYDLQDRVVRTPEVERALTALSRDYENELRKYEEIKAKQLEAQLAQNLEEGKKAERFALLEPPTLPEEPSKPNRPVLMAIAVVLAGGVGFGLMVLTELLGGGISSPNMLTQIVGQPPLAVIPYLDTTVAIARRRKRLAIAAGGLATVGLGAVLVVHTFFMPLDLLVLKLMARF